MFRERFSNRLLAALIGFYGAFTLWSALRFGLFVEMGADFRAFFAAASLTASAGYAAVYDLSLQERAQRQVFASFLPLSADFLPAVVLPPFLLPFRLLLPLGPVAAFGVWTLAHLALMTFYLGHCLRALGSRRWVTAGLLALSFPAFNTLFWGQVNALLVVGIEGFLQARERGRKVEAGLWLGLLLVKPQMLLLLLPGLLIAGEGRILAGFAGASGAIAALSIALVGLEGMAAWIRLLAHYEGALDPVGLGVSASTMINLRMLALMLAHILPKPLTWAITGAAAGGLAAFTLGAFRRASRQRVMPAPGATSLDPIYARSLLSLLSATCGITWHAHAHVAVVLLPPLLRLIAAGTFPQALAAAWWMAPPLAYVGGVLLRGSMMAQGYPWPIPDYGLPALSLLLTHTLMALWGVGILPARSGRSQRPQADVQP